MPGFEDSPMRINWITVSKDTRQACSHSSVFERGNGGFLERKEISATIAPSVGATGSEVSEAPACPHPPCRPPPGLPPAMVSHWTSGWGGAQKGGSVLVRSSILDIPVSSFVATKSPPCIIRSKTATIPFLTLNALIDFSWRE